MWAPWILLTVVLSLSRRKPACAKWMEGGRERQRSHLILHIGSPCTWFQYFSPFPFNNIFSSLPPLFSTTSCHPLSYLCFVSPCPIHAYEYMQVFSFRTTYLSWILLKIGGELTQPMGCQKMETRNNVFLTLDKVGLNIGRSRAAKLKSNSPTNHLQGGHTQEPRRGIHIGA